MRKYLLFLLLVIFVIPSVAFASWWNPFSWFKKQSIQPPVVQVSVPIPVADKKNEKEKVIPKKEKKDILPTSKQILPTISSSPVSGGGASPGVMFGPCPTVGPCSATSVIISNSTSNQTLPVNAGCDLDKGFSLITGMPCGTGKIPVIPNTITTSITSPSVIAIDTFLSNPTAENLTTFCTVAKTLPGTGEKKVLSDTRTDYIIKKNTLYEEVFICSLTLGEYKTKFGKSIIISWLTYNPSDLIDLNNPNESDKIREVKINYNVYWKSLSKYKLIGFEYAPGNEIITPKQQVESIGTRSSLTRYRNISNLFIVPEQILLNIRTTLIRNK